MHDAHGDSKLDRPIRMLQCHIYTDNQSAIQIGSHNTNHSRCKHIDIRYHFVRDDLMSGVYELSWVPTGGQCG